MKKGNTNMDKQLTIDSSQLTSMKKGWKIKKLEEVCEVIAGQSPESKFYNEIGEGIPFYQGKKEFTEKYIGEPTKWTIKITKEAIKDDILMSVRAPVGPINYSTQKICIGRGLASIRAGKLIEKEYLFNFLIKHENEIVGNTGAVFNSINKAQIGAIEIPLPPFPEQQRIVTILDKAFTAIASAKENAQQNLLNAAALFESYLQNVLSDKKWNIVKLNEVCEKVEYGSSTKSSDEGNLPVLRMGNIQNGRLVWDKLKYSNNEEDNKKYLLKHNDVLFNRTNSPEWVGKTAIYKSEMPAIFAGYLIRIYRKEDLLDADFLNYYLNSQIAKDYGNTVVISSVNQANINGTKLKTYPIPLPTLKEQRQIVKKLNSLSVETKKLETIYQQKIVDLEELKKSILDKAFKGEL